MEASKTATTHDAMNHTPKMTVLRQAAQRAEEGRRPDVGEAHRGDFDLKVTLQETEVRESSYAEFLDLLKQNGRSSG